MSVRQDIKTLLVQSDTKLKDVAREFSKQTGKNVSADNLSQKLRKGTLRYDDAVIIANILDYDIKFIKRTSL